MSPDRPATHPLDGVSLAPGLAEGRAIIYRDIFHRTTVYDIDAELIEREWQRLEHAIDETHTSINAVATRIETEMDEQMAAVFAAHAAILDDPSLRKDMRACMEQRLINAEQVVRLVFHSWDQRLRRSGALSGTEDLKDLVRRLLRSLHGITAHGLENLAANSVIVAQRLLPSDTLFLSRGAVAMVLEQGGWASHAAMLTRSRGIPAVGGIRGATTRIATGDHLAVDGSSGLVLHNPDPTTLERFRRTTTRESERLTLAWSRRHDPACTRSGREVGVWANASARGEVEAALDGGAQAIGLFRVENLFLARDNLPDDRELVRELEHHLSPFASRMLTLRLLDVGADKIPAGMALPSGTEGPLGLRGVRTLLRYRDLLDTQLNAALELYGRFTGLHLMLPMVTFPWEVEAVRERLEQLATHTGRDTIPPLGAMIETPAAALAADDLAAVSDFLSIGTNDLTQYTMAASRDALELRDYYSSLHPAVLTLIGRVIEAAGDKPVSVCGEMARDLTALDRLLDLGVSSISVSPPAIPLVKARIRQHA